MYIRRVSHKNKKTGKRYHTYKIVESYRTADYKIKQQILLNLGSSFHVPETQWKQLMKRVKDILNGQQVFFPPDNNLEQEAHRIVKLLTKDNDNKLSNYANKRQHAAIDASAQFESADLDSLSHRDVRRVGTEHVAYHAVQQLQLPAILRQCGLNEKQINLALGNIIGRLVHPGSELATHRYLKEHSSLDELLNTDFTNIPLHGLYRIADILLANKSKIEESLYRHEKDLFHLNETITLYDITNTYFEGRCHTNPKARHGRSKEKRSDCPLVALGLLLDSSGFPKRSNIYEGNVSEPKTLQDMLDKLSDNRQATVVMDAGIATQANIQWLQDNDYTYIVVSREQNIVVPDDQSSIIVKENAYNLVKATLIERASTHEKLLYCYSKAKQEKATKLQTQASQRYETALTNMAHGLTKKTGTKKYEKIMERLGRLKQQYSRVAKHYSVTVTPDESKSRAIRIEWQRQQDESSLQQLGVYCLRTNRQDLDAKTIWNTYVTLTDLEASFRSLKSELGFRPVYHQKEHRVDAHLFISLLAYHVLHTIRYQLKSKGIHSSWETLREILNKQCRITSSMRLQDGRTVHIRKANAPDHQQATIYRALGIAMQPGGTEKTYF